ncbi:amidohydrolase family protein [Natrinema sp. SYSU A 869]|uniref:amidohydrolase family protein n=1 Tax=Natrinema sp. SYSU A 869 TaxID=2871694 RepID=UPI001CA43DC5|nr:amidohydrolase family protein [Natrinema sp. SYSU A 869]
MGSNTIPRGEPEGVTRRQLLQHTSVTAAAGVTVPKGGRAATIQDIGDMPLLDTHLHVTPIDGTTRQAFSTEQAVNWMDDHSVDQAVLLPLESPTSWFYPVPTWWTLREESKFPDRFIPFCTVAPLVAEQFGEDTIRERLETYVSMGARGVGELKAPVPFDDNRVQTVYETCAELDLPVLFHMDGVNLTDEVGLPRTEAMLQAYPNVDFIGHGAGWWASISGDLDSVATVWPEGPVTSGGAIPRLLAEYDNLSGDLSGGSGWNALTRDLAFGQEFLNEYADSLLFGTDKLAPEQNVGQFNIFREFDLAPDQWAQIRYQNLQDLL